MKQKTNLTDLSRQEIEKALAEAKAALAPETSRVLDNVVRAYLNLLSLVEDKRATIKRLRRMIFGPSSEKTNQVFPGDGPAGAKAKDNMERGGAQAKRPLPGHGRNGEAGYRGARTEEVPHEKLKPGNRCPGCRKGKVYNGREPGILVRVTGQAPLAATVYHLEKLRCNLCGEIFEARPPEGVGREKYDAASAAMIGLLKYGLGLPFNRLERLEAGLGIPLAAATQWEIVRDAAKSMRPAYDELVRQAAQGDVLHNDDTTMKVLERMGKRRQESLRRGGETGEIKPERTGSFTSGIVSAQGKRRIALFLTGSNHAGENLNAVLAERAHNLRAPVQMCDALSRNPPKDFKTILANCLAHGRRQFVDVAENFPRECARVLKVLKGVYKNDATANKRAMTAARRLKFHQERSGPLMDKLHTWMEAQIGEKKVEPNSGLGQAIAYMLKRWSELTLFLRKAGAPLDNNICERALKKAILHRKNSLFYKTDNGARVGDLYMSLIHTSELNGTDPFAYLTELQRHEKEVRGHPDKWMPWNYPRARSPDCQP